MKRVTYARCPIWLAPVLLPLSAVIAATIGLSSALQSTPSSANIGFVTLALLLSGIGPAGVTIGLGLFTVNIIFPRLYMIWLGLLITFLLGLSWLSMMYGRGLVF